MIELDLTPTLFERVKRWALHRLRRCGALCAYCYDEACLELDKREIL